MRIAAIFLASLATLSATADTFTENITIENLGPALIFSDTSITSPFGPEWSVIGTEDGFAIKDESDFELVLVIEPGAGFNETGGSMLIHREGDISFAEGQFRLDKSDGSLGIGTITPEGPLHVYRDDGTAYALIEEDHVTPGAQTLLELRNNGTARFKFVDTSPGGAPAEWFFAGSQQDFRISFIGTPVEMRMNPGGNMFITGSLTQNSDRNAKQAVVPVKPEDVLEALSSVEVSRWEYKDTPGVTHIGPMAQDFHAAFGVGHDETGISSIDTAGVALAAIQALAEQSEMQRREIEQLRGELRRLHAVLAATPAESPRRSTPDVTSR